MQIMAVTPFDKRRSKVLISEDFAFVLYNGEIRRYHIEEGAELTEERYRQILDEVLRKRARERAIYLLKEKDRTEAELTKKLREGFYPEEVIREVLELFKARHYIDDEEYGRRYLDNHSQKKSRRRLQYDLQRKGLDWIRSKNCWKRSRCRRRIRSGNFFRKKAMIRSRPIRRKRENL